jgi:hypothetical protein
LRQSIHVVPSFQAASPNLHYAVHQTRLWVQTETILNETQLFFVNAIYETRCTLDDLSITFFSQFNRVGAKQPVEEVSIVGRDKEKSRPDWQRDVPGSLRQAVRSDDWTV